MQKNLCFGLIGPEPCLKERDDSLPAKSQGVAAAELTVKEEEFNFWSYTEEINGNVQCQEVEKKMETRTVERN